MLRSKKWRHRARVVEAATLIVSATAVRRIAPMPRWSGLLGRTAGIDELDFDPASTAARRYPRSIGERQIATAIRAAGRSLPYQPRCLDEATAAQLMLRQRQHPGVVVIGLEQAATSGQRPKAHAWLVGRTGAVTGGIAAEGYLPASCFIPNGYEPNGNESR